MDLPIGLQSKVFVKLYRLYMKGRLDPELVRAETGRTLRSKFLTRDSARIRSKLKAKNSKL